MELLPVKQCRRENSIFFLRNKLLRRHKLCFFRRLIIAPEKNSGKNANSCSASKFFQTKNLRQSFNLPGCQIQWYLVTTGLINFDNYCTFARICVMRRKVKSKKNTPA